MIQQTEIIVNLVANITTLVCLVLFYIYLFGDHTKAIAQWGFVRHWSLRCGMLFMIGGTFFNTLTLSTPDWSEILLNFGLALLMIWVVLFHRNLFRQKSSAQ